MNDQTATPSGAGGAGGALALRRGALPRPDGRDRSLLQPAPRRDRPRARTPCRARTCCRSPGPTRATLNLAWLFQIVLALAHRAGGIAGTVVLKTAFVLATFARALSRRAPARRAPGGGRRGAGARGVGRRAALRRAAAPRDVPRAALTCCSRSSAPRPGVRARSRRCCPRASSGPTPTRASSWRRPCCALRRGRAPSTAARRRAARRAGRGWPLVPLILATPSGAGALGYIANHFRMPSLRPLQEYRVATWPLDGPFFFLAAGVLLATALPASARGARCCRRSRSACSARGASASSPSSRSSAADPGGRGDASSGGEPRALRRRPPRALHRVAVAAALVG